MAVNLSQVIFPKRRFNPKGVSVTNTYNPSAADTVLSAPDFLSHRQDIFNDRQSDNSRDLVTKLLKYDTDMSATLQAFLTMANTSPRFYVYNEEGELDHEAQKDFDRLKNFMFGRTDYSTGFEFTQSMESVCENFRYSLLWRGGLAAELLFDKQLLPADVRIVDLGTLSWYERQPGLFKPEQESPASSEKVLIDSPNFFVKFHRQNPTELYSESMFVSAINTIAARQQVINDLYRIMQKTGYPRMEVTILEEVLRKNSPADIRTNPQKMTTWLNQQRDQIVSQLAGMRPDSIYVHSDSVKPGIMNQGGPSKSLDASAIIEVLNAQNQAALKTMPSIIGRGQAGVNTATVEARVFALSAQELNVPIADFFSDAFTLMMRVSTGYTGRVVCRFDPVELRPSLELEPQRAVKQSRLLENLSLGLITDDEYHMEMFNRLRPDDVPLLSGTNFRAKGATVDVDSVSPNADPLGRSVSSDNPNAAQDNGVDQE